MAKSNTGLFILIGFIILFVIGAIFGMRMLFGGILGLGRQGEIRSHEKEFDIRDKAEVVFDYADFNRIQVDGAWSINIRQGEDYKVTVYCPEELRHRINVEKTGSSLQFTDIFTFGRIRGGAIHADVVLPSLEKCEINGAGSIYLSDFTEERTVIEVNGAATVRGEKCLFQTVEVDISGTANVDFGGSETKNGYIKIDGAGKVVLAISGGDLDGRISGLGNIRYYGEIGENRIQIGGLGSIKKLE